MTDDNSEKINYTIFIPTINRSAYLRRLLKYYNSYGKEFNIIVADSSSDDVKKRNENEITTFKKMNIIHIDKYPTTLNPYHKFADMVKYCSTEYAVFCADDDFIVPNGIEKSVEFLENNSDFTCAHGNYIEFKLDATKKKFYWRPIYPYESILSSDAKQRFQTHLEKYYQTLYAVHRKDFLNMIFEEFSKSSVDPMQFGELLPDMLALIYGKMKRLEVFYAARATASRVAYWPTIFEYMDRGQYEEEYIKFKNCISTHLSKNSNVEEHEAKQIIDNSMQKYLKIAKKEDSFGKIGTLIKKAHLPNNIDNYIKNFYRKIKHPHEYRPWMTKEPENDIEDFNMIRTVVLKG